MRHICQVCRRNIQGEYFEYGWEKILVCARCHHDLNKCDICGLPARDLQNMHDGREICKACLMAGVAHRDTLLTIYARAQSFVEAMVELKASHHIDVRLANARTLSRLLNKEFRPTAGYDQREAGFCHTRISGNNMRSTVYVESFHTEENTRLTCIHEYGHALFYEYCQDRVFTSEEVEGFSRWLEYQYLIGYGNSQRAGSFLDDQSVYGRGLSTMLKMGDIQKIRYSLFGI